MILSSASGPILPLSPIVCSPLRTDLLAASRHSKICFFCILFFHGITRGDVGVGAIAPVVLGIESPSFRHAGVM